MTFSIPSERSAEALTRANEHWQVRHGIEHEAGPTRYCIGMSREAGTFGAAVARQVGERLGWPVYDRELLQRIADRMGVRKTLLENVDERQESWLDQCLEGFSFSPAVSENLYMRHLVRTMLSLAKEGNCIIVGRAAPNILPQATTLRVRIVAPLDFRIETVMNEHHCSHREAAERVAATDRERNGFVTDHFQDDPTDPANYDLVVNVARLAPAECADLICAALDRLQKHEAGLAQSAASFSQAAS